MLNSKSATDWNTKQLTVMTLSFSQ